jgi:hypothetical protein
MIERQVISPESKELIRERVLAAGAWREQQQRDQKRYNQKRDQSVPL